MQIVVNGDALDVVDSCTIAGLLEKLEIGMERVAVEVNLDIVPKMQYNNFQLSPGDKLEIVQFVGGG
jgi:sulfur carrier protein